MKTKNEQPAPSIDDVTVLELKRLLKIVRHDIDLPHHRVSRIIADLCEQLAEFESVKN